MKVTYNAPVVLTFCFVSWLVLQLAHLLGTQVLLDYFSTSGSLELMSPLFYLTMVTHVLGHTSMKHLAGNAMIILLAGPMLEERFGSRKLLTMIVLTAIATGFLNTLIFGTGLIGASGIAFMMITLASCGKMRRGQIPLTLIGAAYLHLAPEIAYSFQDNKVSEFGHIVGGILGILFGLFWNESRDRISERGIPSQDSLQIS
ncbi:MAG TPA: rhomboid family intramembrane serine protease [Candidatus Andersenbacteria bacterium]|nr:rhomboid family intramembrane serine protease [Candidatus Andersenbacteria bacterium]